MDMYISSKNIHVHVAVPTSEFGYYARVRDQFSDTMNIQMPNKIKRWLHSDNCVFIAYTRVCLPSQIPKSGSDGQFPGEKC